MKNFTLRANRKVLTQAADAEFGGSDKYKSGIEKGRISLVVRDPVALADRLSSAFEDVRFMSVRSEERINLSFPSVPIVYMHQVGAFRRR